MSIRDNRVTRDVRSIATASLALALAVALSTRVHAQIFSQTRAVGGISIDANGMATNADRDDLGNLQRVRQETANAIPEGLDENVPMRTVSLRGLNEAIGKYAQRGEPLPIEIECLGGLQQIRYVLVYPEQNDIVLVGPAEGWRVSPQGALVGVSTGRPVMLLDDLVVALRAANGPVRSVISCSIDPTEEGLQRLRNHTRRLRTIGNPAATALGIEQQLGPQSISVSGIPETSHYARVMVAADYRMKRIGMNLEPAPIRGLPGFMEMARTSGRGMQNMLPRWWLAPDYEPLLRDADGLAWELRGGSVKTMTENDFLDAAGDRQRTGRADAVSQKWADLMTARYDDLALAEPVFGQLRNCIDLAIVAALIVQEDLTGKAQASLPLLMGSEGVQTASFPAPRHVASKAAVTKKGRNWLIACGGVQINPWAIAQRSEQSDTLASLREKAAFPRRIESWWH